MHEAELLRILDYVARYSQAHGFPPSYAEIADACDLGSVGHVQYRVNRLIRDGHLTRTPGRARSLVVAASKIGRSARQQREHIGIKGCVAALLAVILAPFRS